MPVIPCNIGKFACRTPHGPAEFFPRGGITHHGGSPSSRANHVIGWGGEEPTYSALILVGLSVQGVPKSKLPARLRSMKKPAFREKDVMAIVKSVRTEQVGDPSSSFIMQKGLYKHKASGSVITEDSVRVILLHLTNESREEFRAHMFTLAEDICRVLLQEEVIVEFQDGGLSKGVYGVHP